MTSLRTGALPDVLAQAARDTGMYMRDLTVLSNDPYGKGTARDHVEGQWFADRLAELCGETGRVHLRGLHYRIVARGGILKPDGSPYLNDAIDWEWLQDDAAKAARWLGYVPFDRIKDERNSPPVLCVPEQVPEPMVWMVKPSGPDEVEFHNGSLALGPGFAADFEVGQPCRIVLWGEKTSLEAVLRPLAERYGTELILPAGETTDSLIFDMAKRADADGRPARVLYFSDFDPSGWQMPISVARKLQALKDLQFPDLDIEIHRVALSAAQCAEHDLPESMLKETEQRAEKWVEAWGRQQTEIDALAALRPGVLHDIAVEAIGWFYDTGLAVRVADAERRWRDAANEKMRCHPQFENATLALASARDELDGIRGTVQDELVELSERLDAAMEPLRSVVPPGWEVPEPELPESPEPLWKSTDDFVTGTVKLKRAKGYQMARRRRPS